MEILLGLLCDIASVMRAQIQGMKDFEEAHIQMRRGLLEKNWTVFEGLLRGLDVKAKELAQLESLRYKAWKEIQAIVLHDKATFYQVLPRLPLEWQEDISTLHCELKHLCLRLQGLTRGMATYVQTADLFVKAVIEESHPRNNRLYGKNGLIKSFEASSLVLNTRL